MRRFLAASFLCAMSLHVAGTAVFAQVPGAADPGTPSQQEPGTTPGADDQKASSAPSAEEPGVPEEDTGQRSSPRVPTEPPVEEQPEVVASSSVAASSVVSSVASSVRPASRPAVRASSSIASSVASSHASSVVASSASSMRIKTATGSFWDRKNFGYSVPLIDPQVVATPGRFLLASVPGNLWLALLFTIVVGWSGYVCVGIARRHPSNMPLSILLGVPAALTMLIIAGVEWLIPQARAQGAEGIYATVSFLRLPGYAFVFYVLMGITDSYYAGLRGKPIKAFDRWIKKYLGKEDLLKAAWFVGLMMVLYSIVSSYRNQEFSLLPSAQLGMILVTLVAIILKSYSVDLFKLVVVRRWKYPSWFVANLGGLIFAAVCVFLTREFQLNPGFMYGAPLGLYLLVQHQRREALLQSASVWWALVVAGIVWSILPFMKPYEVLHDALLAVPFVLIEGLFFELIPIPSIGGGAIFRWRKLVWAVQFFLVTFLLFQFIFRSGQSIGAIQESPPTVFMLIGLACYAAGTACVWMYVQIRNRRSA